MMEDESEEFFYQFERNQLDNFAENPFLLEAEQIAFEEDFFPSKIEKQYKIPISISPLDGVGNDQLSKENKFEMIMRKKLNSGIKIMFGLEKQNNDSYFLEDIDAKIFEEESFLIDLNKLFQEECSQIQQNNVSVQELTVKMAEIQKKAFSSVWMNKTIGKAFYEHFQNFSYLRHESNFLTKFQASFQKLITDTQKIKDSGIGLILGIYQFWMRMFRDFIRQIWKHNQKYSMDLYRNKKQPEKVYSTKSSTSQSQVGDKTQKQKRKPWKKNQIDSLTKVIESHAIFNQARLKQLSDQFGRTPSSISSKIQKMTKCKKNYKEEQIEEDITLDKKIENILRNFPEGLPKQEVVKKISQTYDMGIEQNWKKSVSQMLSSKKEIEKIKGVYSLVSPLTYKNFNNTSTMKDRIVFCLLRCENTEAELKRLTQIYVQLFGQMQQICFEDKQKIKTLQLSISKTLCRYDIFNKDKSRTAYKLCDLKIIETMEIEDFLC